MAPLLLDVAPLEVVLLQVALLQVALLALREALLQVALLALREAPLQFLVLTGRLLAGHVIPLRPSIGQLAVAHPVTLHLSPSRLLYSSLLHYLTTISSALLLTSHLKGGDRTGYLHVPNGSSSSKQEMEFRRLLTSPDEGIKVGGNKVFCRSKGAKFLGKEGGSDSREEEKGRRMSKRERVMEES